MLKTGFPGIGAAGAQDTQQPRHSYVSLPKTVSISPGLLTPPHSLPFLATFVTKTYWYSFFQPLCRAQVVPCQSLNPPRGTERKERGQFDM